MKNSTTYLKLEPNVSYLKLSLWLAKGFCSCKDIADPSHLLSFNCLKLAKYAKAMVSYKNW